MNDVLTIETARVNRDMQRILMQSTLVGESPVRIHSRDTDAGGAPELHPGFVRWIGAICSCGRGPVCAAGCRAARPDEHTKDCEPGCPSDTTRFVASKHKSSPTRFKRALRQLRRIDPKAHDAWYLLAVLGYSWHEALAKLNSDNVSRGKPEFSESDFLVLTLAGGSLLAAAY